MIDVFLTGLLDFFYYILNLLISPIDSLITRYLPSVSDLFNNVSDLFSRVIDFFPWVLSYFGFSQNILSIVITFFVFKYTLPPLVYSFKLFAKWYSKLH